MAKKESIPLYGVIPFFGGSWTVVYSKVRDGQAWHESSLSGYGEFPFERFPDIPVIDYRNNDSVMDVLKWDYQVEESTHRTDSNHLIPLNHFLARVYDLGITIHNHIQQVSSENDGNFFFKNRERKFEFC